eukprot:7578-Heterococcus_DN1.PRE.1
MHANPELCYIAPAATTTASASADSSSGERAVVVARSGRKGQPKQQQNGATATTASITASTNGSTTGSATAAADGDSSDEGSDDSDGAESASDVDSDNEEGDTSDAGESPPTAVETAVGQEEPQQQRDPLVWIFHRMSFMGRAKGDARRRAVFKWFAAMGAALPVPVVTRFLPHMLTPLRRCALDAAANDIGGADEGDVVMTNTNNIGSAVAGEAAAGVAPVADLAAEVMELLEAKVGAGVYLEAITKVNQAMEGKKEKRKADRAVMNIVDPVAAAQWKVERGEQKKRQRKRRALKVAEVKGQKRGHKRARGAAYV